jgi:hypothetical protein
VKTSAALLRRQPGSWDVCEVDLDDPRDHDDLHAGEIIRGIVPFDE